MKFLTLDIAGTTGWAHGDNFASAHVGTWNIGGMSDDKIDRTLGNLYSAVNSVCRANGIDGVIIEAALRGIKKKNQRGITTPTSAHGDRCLTMLNGAARAGAANAGVKLFRYPAPNTWRKAVLGVGFPEKPKEEAVLYCQRNGRKITEHNMAEALCMLQFGVGTLGLLARIKE